MNGRSECSEVYKRGVNRAYVRRVLTVCSTWKGLHSEMKRIRQILVNNNYSNTEFDKQAEILIGKHMLDTPRTPDNKIHVYYNNTFTNA